MTWSLKDLTFFFSFSNVHFHKNYHHCHRKHTIIIMISIIIIIAITIITFITVTAIFQQYFNFTENLDEGTIIIYVIDKFLIQATNKKEVCFVIYVRRKLIV
jgi:cellulose synthase/poly-beta-1,6-N-acetylglucosamine synthase-like glycosyltransferase